MCQRLFASLRFDRCLCCLWDGDSGIRIGHAGKGQCISFTLFRLSCLQSSVLCRRSILFMGEQTNSVPIRLWGTIDFSIGRIQPKKFLRDLSKHPGDGLRFGAEREWQPGRWSSSSSNHRHDQYTLIFSFLCEHLWMFTKNQSLYKIILLFNRSYSIS